MFCSSFFLSYLPTARTSKTVPKFHGLRKKIFKEIDKRLSAGWLQPAFTTSGEKRTPQPCCFHVGGKERGDPRLRRGGGSSRPCGGRTAGQQDGFPTHGTPLAWQLSARQLLFLGGTKAPCRNSCSLVGRKPDGADQLLFKIQINVDTSVTSSAGQSTTEATVSSLLANS